MKVFKRVLGSLKAKLAVGAIIGMAAWLPVAASAQDAVKLESATGVANVTAGDTDYKQSVNATYDQVVKVEVYYHNQEDPNSNKIAKNVNVKIAMPTQAGKSQVINSTVKADNSNEVKNQVNVNLDRDDATLQYIPGSAMWKHNTGTNDNITIEQTKISDDVVLGGQGLTLEDEKPCYNFAATVTVMARVMVPGVKVVKESQINGQSNHWSNNNTANPGDTLKYIISYQNTGNIEQKQVIIRDSLPPKMALVPGTTMVYSSTSPNGAKTDTDSLTDGGVIIGNYGPGANAYVTFQVTIPVADQLACGANEFRNVGVAHPQDMNEYYNTSVTTVTKDCGSTPTNPAYSCDLLTVTKGDNRAITAKVDYTAKDGATLKSVTYDFGDGSTPLTTDKTTVNYTYAKDGNFNITAKLLVTANGKDQTATSATCAKPVSFTTPTTTPMPPSTPSALPNTGAGSVVGLFAAASVVGFIGYRLFLTRRLSRES